MTDVLDQNASGDAELDLYGDADGLDPNFTEQDVLGTGDDDEVQGELDNNGDADIKGEDGDEPGDDADLYDAAIEPSADASKPPDTPTSVSQQNVSSVSFGSSSERTGRRYCCYIGNMTWWTTDADLQDAIYSSGIGDLVDIKFYENRNNGQSKGFALTVFSAESAVRQCMEKLPQKQLHGQPLVVLPYTKSSLAKFEDATRRPDQRGDKKPDTKKEEKGVVNFGTIRIGAVQQPQIGRAPTSGIPPLALRPGMPRPMAQQQQPSVPPQRQGPPPLAGPPMMMSQRPPMQMPLGLPPPRAGPPPSAPPPTIPPPAMNRPPPTFPPMGAPIPMQPMQQIRTAPPGLPPPMGAPPGFPPPGAHINPQVYPGFGAVPPTAYHPQHQHQHQHPHQHQHQHPHAQGPPGAESAPLSEAEFEEIMNRNRTVSSSAISRAVSDAAAGDYASAIETLVTAISLIRQSRVANDDRCKVLITSLQVSDCI
uniref:RRM domain-containing protein n=2 Tax=Plectus sambesii TaxID=2011161 RepID=A0A914WVP3_9BILA